MNRQPRSQSDDHADLRVLISLTTHASRTPAPPPPQHKNTAAAARARSEVSLMPRSDPMELAADTASTNWTWLASVWIAEGLSRNRTGESIAPSVAFPPQLTIGQLPPWRVIRMKDPPNSPHRVSDAGPIRSPRGRSSVGVPGADMARDRTRRGDMAPTHVALNAELTLAYGFLSENPEFCRPRSSPRAGITFVGPAPCNIHRS